MDQPTSLVAVKVAMHKNSSSEMAEMMYENEIAIHSMLNHPNIVKMVDSEINAIMKKPSTQQARVRSFIVTEFCAGGDLYHRV